MKTNTPPSVGVELFTLPQVARALQVPARMVPRILKSHGIPLVTLGPRSRRVASVHLQELLAQCVRSVA
jgi:hypothetical protein